MTEFWESAFRDKQAMWGMEPTESAIETAELFSKKGFKKVLIPGYGYGRNAKVFTDKGFDVTGIEISKTAIAIAKEHFGKNLEVYHGSVSEMPFDDELYDGIFCYALIHLLDEKGRNKLIDDCYNQLKSGGYMVFVAISKNTPAYGEGHQISRDRFESRHGVKLFYYDSDSVQEEFCHYGLVDSREIPEPAKRSGDKTSQKFWKITCKKQ